MSSSPNATLDAETAEKTAPDESTSAATEVTRKPAAGMVRRVAGRLSQPSWGMIAVVIGVVSIAVLAWFLVDARSELAAESQSAADRARAEKIATDYALGAAELDYRDLPAWHQRLGSGTSSEMGDRLDKAANSMEQIIVPLQWVSTAEPIASVASGDENGVYSVDAFVSVLTKNSQAPEGISSTAAYKLQIDSNNDWKITDIRGFDTAAQAAEPGPAAPR